MEEKDEEITLAPLCGAARRQITALAVREGQEGFIESPAACLADAEKNAYGISWNIDGIYAAGRLVGFAMHGRQTWGPFSQVWLDRFLIDGRSQGKGYGRKALELLIPRLSGSYRCKRLFLSVHEENLGAIKLYRSLGFRKTPFRDGHGERIMVRRERGAGRG